MRRDLPPVLLEDRFRRVLMSSPTDGLVVQERGAASGDIRWWSLSAKMKASDALRIVVYVGPTASPHEWGAVAMAWPRQMIRIFWSCIDLYKFACMSSYKRVPSKWVYNQHSSWQATFKSLGFSEDHFLQSSQAREGFEAETDARKCLNHPSSSTLGLLVMLTRFVGCSAQKGGLRYVVSRQAVAALLHGVLASARRAKDLTMTISIQDSWAPAWPCTEPTPSVALHLELTEQLEVDMGPLRSCQQHPLVGGAARGWVRLLRLDCRPDAVCKFALNDLLLLVVAIEGLQALASQLFWYTAKWVEVCVWQSLRRGAGSNDRIIKASYLDVAAVLKSPNGLGSTLLRHVVSGIEATRGRTHLSVVVDTANVGGIQLNVGVFVLGDNRARMACPQVAPAGSCRRGEGRSHRKFWELPIRCLWVVHICCLCFGTSA